ncbi:MAG: DUF5115 domain-containing protein [Prevotella sp.]|nr:DUF5115 domain-containing protein [Prevotella sp.]
MTKKIFLALALAGTLAACTEDYKEWLDPQVVPQPQTVSFGDGSVSTVGVIDFNSITADKVKVCNITAPTASDPAFTPSYTITIGDQTFEIDADGTMSASDLQSYVIAQYGRRPVERAIPATVSMWLGNGVTTVKTATSGAFNITAIPKAPQISQNYYIVGGPNDWGESAKNKTLKFSHSGLDVYEDPVFTVIFNASEGDTWFAIGDDEACEAIANDNDWSKLFGTTKGNGNTDPSGTLDRRYNLSDDGSFCVPAGGKLIKVTLNMMDYSYQIESLNISENYYLIGGPGEWNSSKDQKFSHSSKSVFDDPVFTYTFASTGGEMWFAFGDDEAIDAVGEGTWNKLFGTKGDSKDLSGSFDRRYNLDGDHSFCVDGSAKFYRFSVNMMDYTYEITPLNFSEFYYEIGNESSWSAAHPLYSAANDGKYQGYYYLDGEFKFKPNADNWDDDLEYVDGDSMGGTLQSSGGPNCPNPGAGFYQINLDAGALSYNLVRIEAIGIIGGFNGWSGDVDMTYNKDEGCWEATATIDSDTELKFRANHDWAINWGGDVNNLTQDGGNLIVSAGTHTFKLYLSYQGNNRVVIN